MKKFVAGIIVGAAIATTGSVFASSQLTGVFADFNILVNGNKAQLTTQSAVIDGSSYLPVRAISDVLGYEVQYEEDSRTISLSNDGKKYLKDKVVEKVEENKPVVKDGLVKDLASEYSIEGKLNADLIKAAIEKGELSVNSQDEATGDSLLILIIRENNFGVYNIIRYDNKLDATLVNNEGKTPLHIATIVKSNYFMGELLNHFNVKTKVKDNDGKMPVDYTEERSRFRDALEIKMIGEN